MRKFIFFLCFVISSLCFAQQRKKVVEEVSNNKSSIEIFSNACNSVISQINNSFEAQNFSNYKTTISTKVDGMNIGFNINGEDNIWYDENTFNTFKQNLKFECKINQSQTYNFYTNNEELFFIAPVAVITENNTFSSFITISVPLENWGNTNAYNIKKNIVELENTAWSSIGKLPKEDFTEIGNENMLDKLELEAEQGNKYKQAYLRELYLIGTTFLDKNYQKSFYWFKKAAEQGESRSQNALGDMYRFGKGIAKNYKEAVYWYEKAADQGNNDCLINLGEMYEKGLGVYQDYVEAKYWYKKAKKQGSYKAKKSLKNLKSLKY